MLFSIISGQEWLRNISYISWYETMHIYILVVGLFTENISTHMDELWNDLDYRKLLNVELCILYLYNGNYQKELSFKSSVNTYSKEGRRCRELVINLYQKCFVSFGQWTIWSNSKLIMNNENYLNTMDWYQWADINIWSYEREHLCDN